MSFLQYDAFGETVSDTRPADADAAQRPSSDLVKRVGIALFWAVVAVVVTARVFFYQPDIYASFHDQPFGSAPIVSR